AVLVVGYRGLRVAGSRGGAVLRHAWRDAGGQPGLRRHAIVLVEEGPEGDGDGGSLPKLNHFLSPHQALKVAGPHGVAGAAARRDEMRRHGGGRAVAGGVVAVAA